MEKKISFSQRRNDAKEYKEEYHVETRSARRDLLLFISAIPASRRDILRCIKLSVFAPLREGAKEYKEGYHVETRSARRDLLLFISAIPASQRDILRCIKLSAFAPLREIIS